MPVFPNSSLAVMAASSLLLAACASGQRDNGVTPPSPPMGTPDAMMMDGMVIPTPDASRPDAMMMDGMVIPTPDASQPDASSMDASRPDASAPDASAPDASDPCAGLDCTPFETACATAMCVAGACVTSSRPDGTTCGGSGCSTGSCMAGVCEGTFELDCATCPGGYCALGACVASVSSIAVDFESSIPASWSASGDLPWVVSASGPHGGLQSASSGSIGSSQTSGLVESVNYPVRAQLSFWIRTSSEERYDELEFLIDGAVAGTWSGTTAWTEFTALLEPGAHTIEWRYSKDSSLSVGDDKVWIDDVTITPVSVMSSMTTVDFEASASIPTGFTTSGDASWRITSTMPHGGSRAAESGVISNSETTSLSYAVTAGSGGMLRFWYRTSTERTYDSLELYIDGTLQDSWSGTNAWTQVTFPLAAGMRSLEWRYEKDSSLSSGSDQVWIDDVEFLSETTTPLGNLCVP